MEKKVLLSLSLALLLVSIWSPLGFAGGATPSNVYTNDNAASESSVLQYSVGPGGSLTLAGTFSTGGAGTGSTLASQGAIAITQNGQWLITVDAGSNQLTSFHVNPDGSLSLASIVSSQGTTPVSVTVHRNVVYVLNAGTSTTDGSIAGFALSGTGQLSFIAGSIKSLLGGAGSSPEQIGFDNSGQVLVVAEKAANLIDTFAVTNGIAAAPSGTPSNSPAPYGFAFNNQGYLVLSEAAGGSLSSYSVSKSGTLKTISESVPDFGLAPCWVAISPDGRVAYTSNAHGGTISSYRVSGTGSLTLTSSVAGASSIPTLDLTVNNNGHILYALNAGEITSYKASPDGSLVALSSVSATTSSTGLATA